MARHDSNLDEEKRSYGALWLVLSLFLFVCGLWAIADDNVFRRPWKRYQAEFGRLEINRLKDAIAKEQQRLDADPAYQEASKALGRRARRASNRETAPRRSLASSATSRRFAARTRAKDLNLRFVKSELEELRFQYDDAKHHGRPTDELQARIDEREKRPRRASEDLHGVAGPYPGAREPDQGAPWQREDGGGRGRQADDRPGRAAAEARDRVARLLPGADHEAAVRRPRTGSRRSRRSSRSCCPEFDRNNFDQAIDRVDRCTSCHTGINKAGFEDSRSPYTTHPKREEILGKHPPEKFGCTPCHGGQGPAVNSVEVAHGNFSRRRGPGRERRVHRDARCFRGDRCRRTASSAIRSCRGSRTRRPSRAARSSSSSSGATAATSPRATRTSRRRTA